MSIFMFRFGVKKKAGLKDNMYLIFTGINIYIYKMKFTNMYP